MAWVQEIYDTLYDPNTICVACISHGKDSLAMLRAIKLLGLPLHRIVTSDVWATQDIPADLPPMWEWKKEADKIIKEFYGIEVEHICAMQKPSQNVQVERERERESTERGVSATSPCSTPLCVSAESTQETSKDFRQRSENGAKSSNLRKLTYEDIFYRRFKENRKEGRKEGRKAARRSVWIPTEIQGTVVQFDAQSAKPRTDYTDSQCETGTGVQHTSSHPYGFPISIRQGQWCQRLKLFSDSPKNEGRKINIIQYLGIAADEPKRIAKHIGKPNIILPLVEIGWEEDLCGLISGYQNLLSPVYTTATRDGCWFCHNQGVGQSCRHALAVENEVLGGIMSQISIFDGSTKFKIDKPIRLIELFGGYGSQALALRYLGVPFEHHALSEWAVKSIQAYKDMHEPNDDTDYSYDLETEEIKCWLLGRISSDYSTPMTEKQIERLSETETRKIYNNMKSTKNLGSIVRINGKDLNIKGTDRYCYVMTYSFPCQDLSSAGKGAGMEKGSGTRSGLLWEVERLLNEVDELPQVLLMENVPEVIGTKNMPHFQKWIAFLDGLGYKTNVQVLNTKDFGIPQNRARCFAVSVLGDYYYEHPQGFPLKKRLKDILEKNVDESYYLSNKDLRGTLIKDISNTVRSGGRGSLDRHQWDLVVEADGIQIGKSSNFDRGPLRDLCRTIDTNGKNGVVEWNK